MQSTPPPTNQPTNQPTLIQAIIAENVDILKNEMACQTFDNLANLETKIYKDIKMSLSHIADCVTIKDCPTEKKIFNNTSFYF